jgi:hypothetical protein
MVAKSWVHDRVRRSSFAVYFFLLLFMFIGLTLGSQFWVLSGLTCWGLAVFGWFYYNSKNKNPKCLRTDKQGTKGYIGEEEGKGYSN